MFTRDLLLSFSAPATMLCLFVIFVRRRLYREFPFFFTYIAYALIATLRIFLGAKLLSHFVVYWVTEALYGILALLVLCEAFYYIFALKNAIFCWFRWLLPLTVLLITLGGCFWVLFYHPLHQAVISRVSGIYWFDMGVQGLQGIILLLILALSIFFSVGWQQYEFAVLAGFGISAAVTIIADLFALANGSTYEAFFRYGPPVAYLLATVIWLQAFLRPVTPDRRRRMGLEEMHNRMLEYWAGLKQIKRVFGFRQVPTISPF